MLGTIALFVVAQGRSLAQWIEAQHWNPATQGTLLAMDADAISATGDLDAYNRKAERIGSVTAIVQRTRVQFDDVLAPSPDPFEGMNRVSRLLALTYTLSAPQWKAMVETGLAQADLRPDQRPIFDSLLPDNLIVKRGTVNAAGGVDTATSIPLPEAERPNLRLKLQKGLIATMSDKTEVHLAEDLGEVGRKVAVIASAREIALQKRRSVVANDLKKGDLDWSNPKLDRLIDLPATMSLADMVSRVAAKSELSLVADLRIRAHKLTAVGSKATARDVLEAITMMVGGAFRKVNDLYLLTSDRVGQGARSLKYAAFFEAQRAQIAAQDLEIKQALRRSGRLDLLKFPKEIPDTINDVIDLPGLATSPTTVKGTELPDSIAAILRRKGDPNGVRLRTVIDAQWILPDGTVAAGESLHLGALKSFTADATPVPRVHTPLISAAPNLAVIMRADDPDMGRFVLNHAIEFGITELWLDTQDPGTLLRVVAAAAPKGIHVSLVIRPFSLRTVTDPMDRNLLGEDPMTTLNRLKSAPQWKDYHTRPWIEPIRVGPVDVLTDQTARRAALFKSLTEIKGLANVVWVDVAPPGYEGPTTTPTTFGELGKFGFSLKQRRKFIERFGIDPIDYAPGLIANPINLGVDYFGDDLMQIVATEWPKQLADAHRLMLSDMINAAKSSAPTLVEPLPAGMDATARFGGWLVPWKPGEPIPQSDYASRQRNPAIPVNASAARIIVTEANGEYVAPIIFDRLSGLQTVVVDLGTMNTKAVPSWLQDTFRAVR